MVVARKTDVSARNNWFQRNYTPPVRKRRRSTGIESTSQNARFIRNSPIAGLPESNILNQPRKQVTDLPLVSNAGTMPLWLLRLLALNKYSSILAFLVVAITLIVYGWTVYSQEIWSHSYRRLQSLQRQERQLITTNATLTSKMADEAELPTAELVPPSTTGTIFLSPATESSKDIISHRSDKLPARQQNNYPLGY
jgi:hypothetical protein